MVDDKDISEVIEEQAAALEAGEVATDVADEEIIDETPEEVVEEEVETAATDEPADVKPDEPDSPDDNPAAEPTGIDAPEHWEASIQEAFKKADPETQQVWLDQQKEFQRGFNTVSQEAAQLRRYQQDNIGVQSVLDQVIPSWQAQGMTAEQGLGQLVQLGMAYASNPQQTLIHLAEMAGLDINTLGAEAPYRTSDDIARDNRMQSLEQRLQAQTQTQLEGEISAFQAETDTEGNLKHPLFTEAMDDIGALFRTGFRGSLEQAYEQVVWTTPAYREKMMNTVPATPAAPNVQNQAAAAKKAVNASNQRVKQSRPAPKGGADMDDLSVDDLVARVAAQMEAAG